MNASWWNIHPFVFTQSLFSFQGTTLWRVLPFRKVVGSSGLEPPTSRLSGARSNHLSYEPIMVEIKRLELLTPCLQSRCSPSWATPPYSIEHRASLFCCSAHSVSSWKLVYFLLIKKAKFDKPNFQCTYKVCTIGPSKLNNTYKSNFVIPDLGC